MTAPVTVTTADREAAAANILARLIYQHGGEQPWMDASTQSMRMGEQDDHWEVQAFARHRLAAEAASNAQVAELVEALENITNFTDMSSRYVDADPLIVAARTALARAKSASEAEGV